MWFTEPEHFPAHQLASLLTTATGGELHIALAPQAVWRSGQTRAATNQAFVQARAQYFVEPRSRAEPDFTAVAELLSQPPEARYGWITDHTNNTTYSVLAAGSRWFGLIAIRRNTDIWVRTFTPQPLSTVLTEALPESPKSPAPQIRVLRSEAHAASRQLLGATNPTKAVRQAQRFASRTPRLSAEFYAEIRGHDGKQRHTREPLRVYDTEDGRWTLRTERHYNDELLELTPATPHDITKHLDHLHHQLT